TGGVQPGPTGGSAVAGFDQFTPALVLRQIPPPRATRPSCQAVAIRSCELTRPYLTSDILKGRRPLRCVQFAPALMVLKSPPASLATTAIFEFAGWTVTAT